MLQCALFLQEHSNLAHFQYLRLEKKVCIDEVQGDEEKCVISRTMCTFMPLYVNWIKNVKNRRNCFRPF